MTAAEEKTQETRVFEADVAKLLHLMVHSVYSDRDVFLRELISNAADACERLRYEAIAHPNLLGDDPALRITILIDADNRRLSVEDNGIGMNHDELVQALGTIAHSGTKAFVDRIESGQSGEAVGALIGQFGIGFYSAFMVADRVEVTSRRAGADETWQWSSDGKGAFTVTPFELSNAPKRGTRVVLHLTEEAKQYTERFTLERSVREQSGHVPVPISIIDKPGNEPAEVADGSALWAKPKPDISPEAYTDFYRSVAGQFDEPALTIHFHAEGRQDYTALVFVPGSRPFDLFDSDRVGRIKLYVKRVLITDAAEVLPRYLRFVRGVIDSADLPLNVSREMIRESPLLSAIKKGLTGRILTELEKLAENDSEKYAKVWEDFGTVFKEGMYEDFERRDTLLALSRFKTTASNGSWRSLKGYAGSLKENQTAIYYLAGNNLAHLESSPHLEGFQARGLEVLLLTDPVDSFWVSSGVSFEGKPFRSVTQGVADLTLIPQLDSNGEVESEIDDSIRALFTFMKDTLGEAVSDVRMSDRLTESAVCLVATEHGPDRQLERILAGAGRLKISAKPILEVNPRHEIIKQISSLTENKRLKEDATYLLFEEARILDGDRPDDPRAFSDRIGRVLRLALASKENDRP